MVDYHVQQHRNSLRFRASMAASSCALSPYLVGCCLSDQTHLDQINHRSRSHRIAARCAFIGGRQPDHIDTISLKPSARSASSGQSLPPSGNTSENIVTAWDYAFFDSIQGNIRSVAVIGLFASHRLIKIKRGYPAEPAQSRPDRHRHLTRFLHR